MNRMGRPRTSVSARLLARRRIVGDCWLYTGAKLNDGYGTIGIGRGNNVRAHRAAYEAFVGTIPEGMLVCHRCDTPLCINPAHLFLGTPLDNTRDMIKKGRRATLRGERHGMAKLKDSDVEEIRRLRAAGLKLGEIADRFGISFQHVSALALGTFRATT